MVANAVTTSSKTVSRSRKGTGPSVPRTLAEWTLPVIRELLAANCVEDGRFDWKEMFPNPQDVKGRDRLVRAAAAMANAGGGFLVFGVADKGPAADRVVGIPTDNEFGRELSQQLHRANPAVPHRMQNPPLDVAPGRSIYVVEILGLAAPHADADGKYFERTGGGTDQPIKTHQLRGRFRSHDVLEAPGLHEIRKIAFTFLRPGDWERVRSGLEALTAYAAEGTPKQKVDVLEALTRLAIYTRQQMPDDILTGMLFVSEEATLHDSDDAPDLFDEGFEHAVEVAGHVGYDATLYVRHGFGVFTSARLLCQLLHQADRGQRADLRKLVLEQFDACIDAARRAHPEPWLDAARWYEYKRDHPARGRHVPPPELNEAEGRLLGVYR